MEERGLVTMKGKGEVLTYWLLSANYKAIQRNANNAEQLPPLLFQPGEYDQAELRRRSPRLSALGGRAPSVARYGIIQCSSKHEGERRLGERNEGVIFLKESYLCSLLR